MLLEVENGQVLSASPQRSHPVSRGTLCVKGWNGHQIIHHSSRLKKPLIKENGSFKAVSWERAISFAKSRLESIKKTHGAEAIGVVGSLKCTNEDNYLLAKFARAVIGTPHVDSALRYFQAPTMLAMQKHLGYAVASCTIGDIESADTILIIGADVKAQTARVGSLVLGAAKGGKRCILIDPHEQELSRFLTLQLRPRPETDLALLNCMMHVIIERDLYDPEIKGVARLRSDGLERFTPAYGESVTGVAADDIIRAAELFATAGKGIILYGTGLTQQNNATANVEAVWNLALLTGNIGREGAGILPLLYTCNMQGVVDMGLMTEFLPGHRPVDDVPTRRQLEKAWQFNLPTSMGLTLQQMINEAGKKIKAMYIVGENLAWSAPDCTTAAAALDKLDFLVVQDLFLTETAQKADVVLPACSFAEKEGTFTSMERRVQLVHRAIPPIGDSKPDYEIFTDLANAMGAKWPTAKPQAIFQEIASLLPCYSGLDYKKLSVPGGMIWPCHEASEECSVFKKILAERHGSFADVTIGRPFVEEPDEEYPFIMITGRPAFHRMTGTMISRSFTLDKEDMVATVEINTDDAKALKLRSGWTVLVKTRRGQVKRTVVVTRAVPPKVIFVPIHHKDGHTQSLVNAAIEPESGIPQMKMCAAKLEMM